MRAAFVAAVMVLSVSCSSDAVRAGSLEIKDAFAFAPITLESTGAYLTIVNHGAIADTLEGARCGCARSVTIHQTGPGGMVMRRSLPVPAGESVRFAPGEMHLMLMSLDHLAKSGERIALTLRFAHAGEVTLQVPVRPYAQ
ncbi:MAG TPA: copper chaperone PCu(A)C [Gemmatimonadales bacterium]|nr:copper chaperone PCu(A)C [Gemmatimonadales bacterium]